MKKCFIQRCGQLLRSKNVRDRRMNTEHWWNDSDRVKPVHVPLLSTTNPIWIGFGSSWNLRDERDRRLSASNDLIRKVARRFGARSYDVSPIFNLLA